MIHIFDLQSIITSYGYLGIFIIVFLESGIFFLLPGDSLLFTAGLFAVAFGLKIYLLIPIIFVATFLGGATGYEIGVHIVKLRRFAFFRRMLKQEHIETAERFFNRHGRMAITFSRFIPVVRTFVPIVAGVAHMHYPRFLKYSIISSLLWSVIVTSLGYFLGAVFPQIKDYLSWILVLIVLGSVVPMYVEWRREKKRKA